MILGAMRCKANLIQQCFIKNYNARFSYRAKLILLTTMTIHYGHLYPTWCSEIWKGTHTDPSFLDHQTLPMQSAQLTYSEVPSILSTDLFYNLDME